MNTEDAATAAAQLRDAFDDMIAALQRAREAIDDPALHSPPATPRQLAEGYRYLLGFLHGGIERALEDVHHPRFRRALHPLNKATIDNADAVYLRAGIDGERCYRVRGRGGDSGHWRGGPPRGTARAPQYVIFELASGYAGDSGSLEELRPGSRINTGTLDGTALAVDEDGSFEIVIAPERPPGWRGNFLQSVRESHGVRHVGTHLTCRQLFHDWERELPLELEILMEGCQREPAAPLDPAGAACMLATVGALTENQMTFWNAFYAITLGAYGKVPGTIETASGKPFMPRNDINSPNALGIATGGGQSTNIYAGGVFDLGPDEALVIEARLPREPLFLGMHLANLWGESLDFESYQSSLNGYQAVRDEDGVRRWIIAHRDPGYSNWLDTTGLAQGFLTFRASYAEPPPAEDWPTLTATHLQLDALPAHLPPGSRRSSAAEREADRLMRHRHVQRRYRQY